VTGETHAMAGEKDAQTHQVLTETHPPAQPFPPLPPFQSLLHPATMISQQTMDRNNSVSPSRRTSFGNALSALGAKISRTLSRDEATDTEDPDTRSINTVGSTAKGT